MGLLRTILIIIAVWYLLKILARIFAPVLMRFAAKKAEEKFGGQFSNQRHEAPKKEGEVTIDKMPRQKQSNKDVGDYVEYEEID